ncbi:phosphatidylinositol-specific phospholipase C1-like protein [Seonamhaeicola aphaedonensis]|uniref:Calcium-dependent phosphoinositide phospholipase C n=1 Tax=Seonamhaeicola aphaedonensis TaxID=1461338 RepID=A0A3D9HDC2_9FLAO|nr:phosphatidylinositol-specific phospholipase C1-like protein [Seonamhaeicola aphaedonensis]RED47468.1 calcium-dependent phosphoinositide phospholipase C [Seonamhaeicola aphaedonensis]
MKQLVLLVVLLSLGCSKEQPIKLNDIQVIGSHNSYKIAIEQPLLNYIALKDSSKAKSLEYEHISIVAQLNLGLRNLELDVFYDPKGGHFSNPKGLDIVKQSGETPMPYDEAEQLKQPGFKLFHIQDIDFRSHHLLFKEALKAMKKWSDNNPAHLPIIILMNTKDKVIPDLTKPIPFSEKAYQELDAEIFSVFAKEDLIRPDDVRGNHGTLEEAVLKQGWPKLEDCKGKFLFVLDEKAHKNSLYMNGDNTLKNRVFFVNSKEGNPESAFRIVNNPITDFEYIKHLVAQGYMVRTRADAGTKEARTNDYTKFEKAKASGAQVISTDYYQPSRLFKSTFEVKFEDGTYERIKNIKNE